MRAAQGEIARGSRGFRGVLRVLAQADAAAGRGSAGIGGLSAGAREQVGG